MLKRGRRKWSLLIIMAMLFSLLSGMTVNAAAGGSEFLVGWADFAPNSDVPEFKEGAWNYSERNGFPIKNRVYLCIGTMNGEDINPVGFTADQFVVTDLDTGTVMDDSVVELMGTYRTWDNEAQKDVELPLSAGIVSLRFKKTGHYKLMVNDGSQSKFVILDISLQDVDLYTSKDVISDTTCVSSTDDWYDLTPGETYYLCARSGEGDGFNREEVKEVDVQLDGILGKGIDGWKTKKNLEPIPITIPANFTWNQNDIIRVWTTEVNPEGKEEIYDRKFHKNEYRQGLLIAGAEWDKNLDHDVAPDPETHGEDYRKDMGTGVWCCCRAGLIFTTATGYTKLYTNQDIQKLSVVDTELKPMDEKYYTIDPYVYDDKGVGKTSDDVFDITIRKVERAEDGSFRECYLKYTDGETTSYVRLNIGMPDTAIYGKPIFDPDYILGQSDTGFDQTRNTFYILFEERDLGEYGDNKVEVNLIRAKGKSSDVKVSLDKEKKIVMVTVDPEADEDVEVYVEYEVYEEWGHRDDQGDYQKDDDNGTERRERNFWFQRNRPLTEYEGEALKNVTAVDAVEAEIAALPASYNITVDDKAAVEKAEADLKKLTKLQTSILKPGTAEALTEIRAALDAAIAKKNEIDARKAAAQKTKEDLEAAEKALKDQKAAAEKALKEQKDEADKALKKQKDEADKALKNQKAAADKAAKDAADKALADKKKAVSEATKKGKTTGINSVSPKAKTILYDAKSKSLYKVVKASKSGKAGTVEYYSPFGTVTKMNIPETITFCGFKYKVVSIGAKAFAGQVKMTSVTVSKNITSIGAKAFSGCTKAKTFTIKTKSLKSVGAGAMQKINKKAVIKVPAGKKAAYTKLFTGKGQAKTVKVQ